MKHWCKMDKRRYRIEELRKKCRWCNPSGGCKTQMAIL